MPHKSMIEISIPELRELIRLISPEKEKVRLQVSGIYTDWVYIEGPFKDAFTSLLISDSKTDHVRIIPLKSIQMVEFSNPFLFRNGASKTFLVSAIEEVTAEAEVLVKKKNPHV